MFINKYNILLHHTVEAQTMKAEQQFAMMEKKLSAVVIGTIG